MSHIRILDGLIVATLCVLAAGCSPATPPAATVPMATAPSAAAAAPALAAVSATPVAVVTVAPTAMPPAAPTTAPTAAAPAAPTAAPTTSAMAADSTIRLQVVPAKSEARYRVREQLVNVSLPNDAIGRTNAITGTIVGKPDGSIVSSESKFVVNLGTLVSDRSQRDNFIKGNVLQTNQYPDAIFVPKQQTGGIYPLPASGQVAFKLTGDLTVRNVTKPVTWEVNCQGQGTEGLCHATTSFTFGYFDMTAPRVPVVLSIVDNINLEVDVQLQQVGAGG